MIEEIKHIAKENLSKIIALRQALHKNPELSFKEFETSKAVQEFLQKNNISFKAGFVKTGIVAKIEGLNPEKNEVVLRADLDALPIQEENKTDYCSTNSGVMHACGHDVHTASLLGSAIILNKLKNKFEGTIKLIFQPGEEQLPGGAKLMLEEGVLKTSPKACIAQHVFPDLVAGKVGFKSGIYMASADELHVEIRGKGGHAALPHLLSDPILMTAQIINSLQQIISRNNNPDNPSVLSFGYIKANGATNVIPDKVILKGTFRTFDEEWRKIAHEKMKSIAESICQTAGGECDFNIKVGYPFLKNDVDVTERARKAAEIYLGKNNVIDLDLRMTSEDFSYFSQVAPSCFYRLGTGDGKSTRRLHTSTFDIDESALLISSGLMAYIALEELSK